MVEITKSNTLSLEASEPIITSAPQPKLSEKFRHMYCKIAAGVLLAISANVARSEDLLEAVSETPPRRFLIGGGGHLPEAVHRKFVKMAGGKQGKVLVCPSASKDAKHDKNIDSYWKWQHEVGKAKIIHADEAEEADKDEFVEDLNDATAVWLNGGDQGDLVDLYRNTKFHKALQKFSERGGLIGGSSAGASAMSKLMIRKGLFEAELDEGFGFVPWAVIDQHHLREGRAERLLGVSKKHPQQLCFGIKDRTALILNWTAHKVIATVIGDEDVRILRDQQELKVLKDGDTIDLADLQMVIPPLSTRVPNQ